VVGTGANSIAQRIESFDSKSLAGKTITISFYAKRTSGSGNLLVALHYPNATDNFSALTKIGPDYIVSDLPSSEWTRYSVTVTLPAQVANGLSLRLYNSLASTTLFTGVQLEAGTVATPFRRNAPSIQAELAACQRYYVRCTGDQVLAPGFVRIPTMLTSVFSLPVEMRTTPTIETNTSNSVNFAAVEAGAQDFTSLLISKTAGSNSGTRAVGLNATSPSVSMIDGRGGVLRLQGSTAFVGFSAEL
jgi:hypothetical protein